MKSHKKQTSGLKAKDVSLDGFMGSDRRSLAEIVRADADVVKKLNLTHRAIAGRMASFRDLAHKGLGEFIPVTPHFEASCEVARGFIPCPFGETPLHRKTIVTVRNLLARREIVFSDLNIHLIASHGFYEGKNSPFRLEPTDLADVLEIGRKSTK